MAAAPPWRPRRDPHPLPGLARRPRASGRPTRRSGWHPGSAPGGRCLDRLSLPPQRNTHWEYRPHETDLALSLRGRPFADFLGGLAAEIAFGANMTTLTFPWLGRWVEPGGRRRVVVTELDHHANVDTWRSSSGARPHDPQGQAAATTGQLDWDDSRPPWARRHACWDRGGLERARDRQRRPRGSRPGPATAPRLRGRRHYGRRTAAIDAAPWAATSSRAPPTNSMARTSAPVGPA